MTLLKQSVGFFKLAVNSVLLNILFFVCSTSFAETLTLSIPTTHESRFPTPPTLGDKTLGTALANSGVTVAVSARFDGDSKSGSVYIFNQQKRWVLASELTTPNIADNFAKQIILTDKILIVSADRDDSQGEDSGAVYIFEKGAGANPKWQKVAKLTAPNGQEGVHFGAAIFLSDNNVLYIGAPADGQGKVYIYRPSDGFKVWGSPSVIVPNDPTALSFGAAIAQEGDTLAIGAPKTDDKRTTAPRSKRVFSSVIQPRFVTERGDNPDYDGFESGVIFVYTNNTGQWFSSARLSPSNRWSYDHFGHKVAIKGHTIIGSVPHKFVENELEAGSVYAFEYEPLQAKWQEKDILTATPPEPSSYFGRSFSLLDKYLLVGADKTFSNGINSGEVFLFSQDINHHWQPIYQTSNTSVQSHDRFGTAVALAADKMIVASKTGVYSFQNQLMEKASAIFYAENNRLQLDEVMVDDKIYQATLNLSVDSNSMILILIDSGLRKDLTQSDNTYASDTGQLIIPKLIVQQISGKDVYYRVVLKRVENALALQFSVESIKPTH
ncbi:MAG: hypothetical protein KAG19_08715 [Methylococcales bacterium]|nr:hypothetical protein [Methylococcales bacterium]